MTNGTATTTTPAPSFLGALISQLKDQELVTAGPDILTAISQIQAAGGNQVAALLAVHRLAAALLQDQVVVEQNTVGFVLGNAANSLTAAIAAAKAALAPPTAAAAT